MRLAFITPSFFGYEESIAQAFRDRGVQVDQFDERPSNSAVSRAVLRVAPQLAARRVRAHFDGILRQMSEHRYDALLIIKGENLPPYVLRAFSERNPHAVRMFYTFDSLANSGRCVDLFPDLDVRYSFDRGDVAARDDLRYKSLFFAREFAEVRGRERAFDASFVGTLHSDRYSFYHGVVERLSPERCFAFFYSPARWFFALQRVFDRRMRRIAAREVSFDKMPRSRVAEVFGSSRAVVDYQRPGQDGLTMRTFEALGSGAALITANRAILDESFYDPARILVVPRDADSIDGDAVREWVAALDDEWPAEGFDQYGIDAWVDEFLQDVTPAGDA